jgi:hypothetical protein
MSSGGRRGARPHARRTAGNPAKPMAGKKDGGCTLGDPTVRRDKLRDFTVIGRRWQGPETGKPPKLGRAGDLVISFLESRWGGRLPL